jgi:hypothetical protein
VLDEVLQLVAARGWFDTTRAYEKSIHLTQGACLWLLLTRGGVSDTYVKCSTHLSLETEARRCAEASRCYATLVPRFVGHAQDGSLHVLACRAVEYGAFLAGARAFEDLRRYFAATTAAQLPADLKPVPNADLRQSLGGYFAAHPLASWIERTLDGPALRRAEALPDLPQHGDLVVNNFGQTASGALVIFDWEDFGASCLPGLDLFTLELSLAGGDAARLLAARMRADDPTQRFQRAACSAMRLDWADYAALTPIYALVFRHLKRNYGPGVRERFDRVLLELSRRAFP